MKEPWGTVIAFASVIAVTFALTWLWRDAVWGEKLASAKRDTTITLHPEYTLPYVAQGPVVSNVKPQVSIRDTVIIVSDDSSAFRNGEHDVLLNTIGRLQAHLYELENDTQEFREDSTRYSLMVLYDPKKNINERFWRWLQIKPYPYSDTSSTITQTIVQPGPREWIPWGVAGVAIILLILNMLYG